MPLNEVSGIYSFKISFTIFLCLSMIFSYAKPLLRGQRQTITGELSATGLTNIGTSYNPYHYNQNPIKSYQPQQSVSPYDGDLGKGNAGSSWYDRNHYGQSVTGNYGPKQPSGYGRGYENVGRTWPGFGAGKNPYGVRPHQQSQHGIKY